MLSAYPRSTVATLTGGNGLLRRSLSTAARPTLASLRSRAGRSLRTTNIARSTSYPLATIRQATTDAVEETWLQRFKETLGRNRPTSTFSEIIDGARVGARLRLAGYLGNARNLKGMIFVPLDGERRLQLICIEEQTPATYSKLKSIRANSAVEVHGVLQEKRSKPAKSGEPEPPKEYELLLKEIYCVNEFPKDILVGENVKYGPEQRHLQIRFDEGLRERLAFRSGLTSFIRRILHDFHEIETPILFKSTPEGAREFLVPTRTPGLAYALPQSPQQYKQILMASGIRRYFQIAHCFRDEDLRADRQPEFLQLDMEMAFANGKGVMHRIEDLIAALWYWRSRNWPGSSPELRKPFLRMTYDEAMKKHGVDKPDLRIKDLIHRVEHITPSALKSMITSLEDPIIEAFKINLNCSPDEVRAFVSNAMDSPDMLPFHTNPDGGPGVLIYDPTKPLEGLEAFGHEGVESLKTLYSDAAAAKAAEAVEAAKMAKTVAKAVARRAVRKAARKAKKNGGKKTEILENTAQEEGQTPEIEQPAAVDEATKNPAIEEIAAPVDLFQPGDLIILQARPRAPLSGGSTALGRLRTQLHRAAVAGGHIEADPSFEFLWVTDFPLFTPTNDADPGQGGLAGFSATHHPFTSPKTAADVDALMRGEPLAAKADHYDLVVNGVELGGGSTRIHSAEMQEWIMREVLKMPEERIEDFRHLLETLRAGCPPHAGIALGLDRLVAVMTGCESIRDVIAFPKNNRGEDMLVGSPTRMTESQEKTYHLRVVDGKKVEKEDKVKKEEKLEKEEKVKKEEKQEKEEKVEKEEEKVEEESKA